MRMTRHIHVYNWQDPECPDDDIDDDDLWEQAVDMEIDKELEREAEI